MDVLPIYMVTWEDYEAQHIPFPKTTIASVKGDIHNLLQAERLALNLLGRISGIATQTDIMIQIARKNNENIRICATRKTVPGLSKYDKYAVNPLWAGISLMMVSEVLLYK